MSSIPNIAGSALTVHGPVDPATLGLTLMHEHIFLDIRRPDHNPRPGWGTAQSREPLTLANLAAVRRGQFLEHNDVLADFDEMVAEVSEFRDAGGASLVEVTSIGLGRDAAALGRLASATGVNIVMGSGWYEKNFHPENMDELTVEQMCEQIVRDITVGVDGTDIRSGIIGEVGIEGNPLTPNELKSVRASGRASRITGAPISFHHGGFGEEKFRVLDILDEEGADLRGVTMGHTGGLGADLPFARRLLARGVSIEADFLGTTGSPWGTLWPVTDFAVARGLAALIDDGHAEQILLGTDVCQRIQLKRYGGHGYGYIINHFVPALQRLGVTDEVIEQITVRNPARALTFSAPR